MIAFIVIIWVSMTVFTLPIGMWHICKWMYKRCNRSLEIYVIVGGIIFTPTLMYYSFDLLKFVNHFYVN